MVALVLYHWVIIQDRSHRPGEYDVLKTLLRFEAGPKLDIPISDSDPHLGSLDSPVQIVVFGDLRCPGCRRFATEMTQLTTSIGNKLVIVFKHFPLDAACNGIVKQTIHPGACEAAWAVEAARQQGKFWAFHDAAFAPNRKWRRESVDSIATRAGLDIELFNAARSQDEVKQNHADDQSAIRHAGC